MSDIAIFSDIHLGVHQNSDFWLDLSEKWVDWFVADIKSRGIDMVIFAGDYLHYRDEVSVKTLHAASNILNKFDGLKLYMITGNHDCYYKDTSEVHSLSICSGRKNVHVIDSLQTINLQGINITFCPWGTKVSDIPQSEILVGHFELINFKMNAFKVCEQGDEPTEMLSKAPLVFSGHFHTRDEKEYSGKHIIYVGNPFQMDFGDAYQRKGYYILHTNSDNLFKFVESTFTPKHLRVMLSELITFPDVDRWFNESVKDNIIKLVIDKNISSNHLDLLTTKILAFKPADLRVDYDINYNKMTVNNDTGVDLSGIDITKAIEDFINLLDVNNKPDIIRYTLELYAKSKI